MKKKKGKQAVIMRVVGGCPIDLSGDGPFDINPEQMQFVSKLVEPVPTGKLKHKGKKGGDNDGSNS